ncbi:MAG: hypothetical protein U9R23_04235 [Candidatus Cloacimonadota bacterium]|nr:hypothetical protein [Candidatus Cloacimonadota bacterium]
MDKYKEFLRIAKCLNTELDITPVLYGSLGLSRLIKKDLDSKDIDILVPQKYITTDWSELQKTLSKIDYQLVDEKEHEFIYLNNKIGIAFEEDLFSFAKVDHKKLKIVSDNGVNYKILDLNQYRMVYEVSKNDSYRSQKNNKKDLKKIKLIDSYIKNVNYIT